MRRTFGARWRRSPDLRAHARERGWDNLRLLSAGNNIFEVAGRVAECTRRFPGREKIEGITVDTSAGGPPQFAQTDKFLDPEEIKIGRQNWIPF